MDIEGKVILITGGGGGIGAGIAEAFAEQGGKVVITDINLDYAKAEAQRIGRDIMAYQHDVTSDAQWRQIKQEVEQTLGPVDILCNNAGISLPFQPLEEVSEQAFSQVIDVNLKSIFLGCKTFMPAMKARRSGHIVNTSSVNGQITHPNYATYSASKFAVSALSETIYDELAPFGVGVSILYPGLTRSRMAEQQVPDLADDVRAQLEALMMDAIWVGRAVVKAVQEKELHIISHPDHLPKLQARYQALLSAFGEPAQPDYVAGPIPIGQELL